MPVQGNYLRNVLVAPGDTVVQGPSGMPLRHREFNVKAFGATGNGSTDDSTAIQNAAVAATGATLFFPKPASYYKITGPITIFAGTTILLDPGVIIEQITKYTPVFDVNDVDGVTVEGNGALLRYTGDRTRELGVVFRTDNLLEYGAAVWISGNRCTVRNLHVTGLTNGVRLSCWDESAGVTGGAYFRENNVVENLLVEDTEWGVKFSGQANLTLRGLRGRTSMPSGSVDPDHIIYGAGQAGRCRNVVISDCTGWDLPASNGFAFKGIDGGTFTNLSTRNCSALLSTGDASTGFCTDLAMSNLTATGLLGSLTGAIYMEGGDIRVRMDGINLHHAASARAIRVDGTDCTLSNITIRSRHDVTAANYDIQLIGKRNTVDGVNIFNVQDDGTDYATGWRGISFDATSVDCVARVLTMRNVQIGVDVQVGATNPRLDLTSSKITPLLYPLGTTVTTMKVSPGNEGNNTTIGDAVATLQVLLSSPTNRWNSPLTANRAVTLSTTSAYKGARFHIVRGAASTGAFTLDVGTGPLKSLATGQWCDVEYDGAAWLLTAFGSL